MGQAGTVSGVLCFGGSLLRVGGSRPGFGTLPPWLVGTGMTILKLLAAVESLLGSTLPVLASLVSLLDSVAVTYMGFLGDLGHGS